MLFAIPQKQQFFISMENVKQTQINALYLPLEQWYMAGEAISDDGLQFKSTH